MRQIDNQNKKPLHIYFRDDMDTYITPEILNAAMKDIDAEVRLCKSWSELSTAIADEPASLVFHINMVNKQGSISEFMLMLETMIKYADLDCKPNIGVGIEADTPLSAIKELQKHKILGIAPSSTTIGAEYTNIAIRNLINGEPYWPKEIISRLPGNKQQKLKSNIHLTERQKQVYDLIASRGLSNKQIARTLNISESTVKIHVSAIMKALCVRNRTQLALTK